jgi:hypothetical protein
MFRTQRIGKRGIMLIPPKSSAFETLNLGDAQTVIRDPGKLAVLHPSTLVRPHGGTLNPERRSRIPRNDRMTEPSDIWERLILHGGGRSRDIPKVLSGLAYSAQRGWLDRHSQITLEAATWIDPLATHPGMDRSHRAVGQTRVNGMTVQDLALLNSSATVFFEMAGPYVAADLLPSEWNRKGWQLFESRHKDCLGARCGEEQLLQNFVSELTRGEHPDPDMILEYAEKIKVEAIEAPLEWAMEKSKGEITEVFRTQLEASKSVDISRGDVSRCIDELHWSGAVDAS